MSTEKDQISFFATAGRGTESFAADEIRRKLILEEVSVRDGKVFFAVPTAATLNIKRILALRSVERLFVNITDYNNTAYITDKRTFLNKLMSTVTVQDNFLSAKVVLAELLSQKWDKMISNGNMPELLLEKCNKITNDGNMPEYKNSFDVPILNGFCSDSVTISSHSKGLHQPAKHKCSVIKASNDNDTSSRCEMEKLPCVDSEPAAKSRKLEVSESQTVEVSLSKSNREARLFDRICEDVKQPESRCEHQDVLNYSPECKYQDLLNYSPGCRYQNNSSGCIGEVDETCTAQVAVDSCQVRHINSHCGTKAVLEYARKSICHLEKPSNDDKEAQYINNCSDKMTVVNNLVCGKCVSRCKISSEGSQQHVMHQHSNKTDNTSGSICKGSLSFRMSIKCSGKISRWLNIKKLSRDLGWRVARATGWRIDLRNPQYQVCVHISNEHVTVGVPLTRFPLSRRPYVADFGLRTPIAWIMSQLCSIKPGDIVLDPMCGKATILFEASWDIKNAWFLGSDSASNQIDRALQNVNKCDHSETVSLLQADGLKMPYRDSCIDVVVCDAPFNHKHLFALAPEYFYYRFIKEIYRVLRPKGCCVLLISEQLKHTVLSVIQGTTESQGFHPDSSPRETLDGLESRNEQCEVTNGTVMLTLKSSHYVKLGESHACILVFNK